MIKISKTDLDVKKLASILNITRITLYRKKNVTNLTPSELITVTRLKKAAALLVQGNYRIYQVATMVGFSSQSNFAQSFHKQFGMSSTEYVQAKKEEKNK